MEINQYQLPKYRVLANHEAGHYFLTRLFGFKPTVIKLKIVNHTDHAGYSDIDLNMPITNLEEVIDYCEKRIQILYAGALAESLTNDKVDNTKLGQIWNLGGKSDCEKVRELMRFIRNIKYPASITETEINANLKVIEGELLQKAGTIVEENAGLICGMGGMLFEKIRDFGVEYTVTEEEFKNIRNYRLMFYPDKI
jgi:hypothetical protein